MNNQFTTDNTEGYTDEQLQELNRRYDEASQNVTDLDELQHIAERILAAYDTEQARQVGRLSGRIEEQGNGFPSVGDYVSDRDGNLYQIICTGNNISTNGPIHGNSISAVVEVADWSDTGDEDELHSSLFIVDR